jgi:hypothetical protein
LHPYTWRGTQCRKLAAEYLDVEARELSLRMLGEKLFSKSERMLDVLLGGFIGDVHVGHVHVERQCPGRAIAPGIGKQPFHLTRARLDNLRVGAGACG